jgi:hypothetical protein
MPQCIFCLKEHEQLTDEHLFPAAIGGTIKLHNSTCAECNHGFSKFEQPVALELAPLRFLFQIPDRRGNLPSVDATVNTAKKAYDAKLEGGGKLRLIPEITQNMMEDGKREITYRFLSDEAKGSLAQKAKARGHELVELGPGEPEEAEVHFGGDIHLVGCAEGLRMAAKIAYVGLARYCGMALATSEQLSDVRRYVLEGTGTPVARLFLNERYMQAVQQGPHQHSLTLAGRNDKKRVDAIVRLFGGLCYFVQLSTNYLGADFSTTVVLDAYRGEQDGILLEHPYAEILQIEDVSTNPATSWDDLYACGLSFVGYLEREIEGKQEQEKAKRAKGLPEKSNPG